MTAAPDFNPLGWRRQRLTLEVLTHGPGDPADWKWTAIVGRGAVKVLTADPVREPSEAPAGAAQQNDARYRDDGSARW